MTPSLTANKRIAFFLLSAKTNWLKSEGALVYLMLKNSAELLESTKVLTLSKFDV